VLLPAHLLVVGVDVWLGVVERRHAEDFETMSRHLSELRDDANGGRDCPASPGARSDHRSPCADAAAAAPQGDYGACYRACDSPRLRGREGDLETPLRRRGRQYRFALQTLADLWQFQHTGIERHPRSAQDRPQAPRQGHLGEDLEKRDDCSSTLSATAGRSALIASRLPS
jgi:hypothetical protein